ncbi:MAG: hypothetical protein HFG27_01010 [Provencibacterium sp.]|nr:hypothetical protein [Provencibacterium sp.]
MNRKRNGNRKEFSLYISRCLALAAMLGMVLSGCSGVAPADPSSSLETAPKESSLAPATKADSEEKKGDVQHGKYGLSRNELLMFPKLSAAQAEANKKSAEAIRGGELVVYTAIEDKLPYDIEKIDWNVQFSNIPTTFQLYLQCLKPVQFLTASYEETEELENLELAARFIESWRAYSSDLEQSGENPWVWDQHGTALRTEILIYYLTVAEEAGALKPDLEEMVLDILEEHGEFLSSADNYHRNHNHGVYEDRALIYLSYFLNNDHKDTWLNLAKERVTEQWNFAFTSEMVNTENSFAYHLLGQGLFQGIADFLNTQNDSYGTFITSNLTEADNFTAWMLKPNGRSPLTGDSSESNCVDRWKTGNQTLVYASTLGELGEKPLERSRLFRESGYFSGREFWSSEDSADGRTAFDQAVWTMFKSGYSSTGHKHADDNSFILYAKGYDIFVGSGLYGYVKDDARTYITSAKAHNSVIVDETSYLPLQEGMEKTGICKYVRDYEAGYDHVVGFNNIYDGVQMKRHFVYLDEAVLLYDEIRSDTQHTYSQLFQCSKDTVLIESNDSELLLKIADTGYYARVKQLLPGTTVEIIEGNENTEYGKFSIKEGQLDYITTVKFNMPGDNVAYATLITIENADKEVVNLHSWNFDAQTGTFTFQKVQDGEFYSVHLK